MTIPYGRWIAIERQSGTEPFICFVYMDQSAGPSAKGGRRGEPDLAERPSTTIRLTADTPMRELEADEIGRLDLPVSPPWLELFGPQPDPARPWRDDPLLRGLFHLYHPDDLEVIVHRGDPRRTGIALQLRWARLLAADPGPVRMVAAPVNPSHWLYVAELIDEPETQGGAPHGERMWVVSVHGLSNPLRTTIEYLSERGAWRITPCDRCGATEAIDPPSLAARSQLADAPSGIVFDVLSLRCPFCTGMQLFTRR